MVEEVLPLQLMRIAQADLLDEPIDILFSIIDLIKETTRKRREKPRFKVEFRVDFVQESGKVPVEDLHDESGAIIVRKIGNLDLIPGFRS